MEVNLILEKLEVFNQEVKKAFESVKNVEDLQVFHGKYIGRKSLLNDLFKLLKECSSEEKKQLGPKIQALRTWVESNFEQRQAEMAELALSQKLHNDWIDVTKSLPLEQGSMHPLSQVQKRIEDIFMSMGFEIADGPEVETEWFNFDALNIPPTHPARDMQDTFFVSNVDEDPRKNSVLRTHTSNLQVRKMIEKGAPLRIIAPGRVYRNEDVDATHDAVFYQFECLVVDRDISIAHLKGTLETFLAQFFEKPIKTRFRPGYFPFVEPGLEVDIWFELPGKKGKWLELLGAGMVHRHVLESGGIDPEEYSGFAFGLGMTRLAMMKYSIDDIRYLSSNKKDFLEQF